MKHKILVVDDHPETLSIIQSVLEQNGYDVVGTQSSLQAVSLATSEMPDLIMVDGMMPEMDGWEVCRQLRNNDLLASIPIIMFSAVGEAEQKLAGFNAGADDYLTKPTEPEEMIERVEALLAAVPPQERRKPTKKTQPEPATGDIYKTRQVDLRTPATPMGETVTLSSKNNLVVVVGARGGCGTTTMAINLASSMATIGIPTTLVDLDLTQGHIALYLKQKATHNINQLTSLTADKLRATLSDATIKFRDNFQLLLARTNLLDQHHTLSANQALDMVNALSQPGHSVVIDIGRGITAVTRPIVEQADQIIVCLSPERIALAAAKKLLTKAQDTLFSHAALNTVLFDFLGGRDIPQQAIESYLGKSLMAIIPVQTQELTKSVNKGVPLVELHADGRTALIFRRLAHQIAQTI